MANVLATFPKLFISTGSTSNSLTNIQDALANAITFTQTDNDPGADPDTDFEASSGNVFEP